jgi:hypothetical protein
MFNVILKDINVRSLWCSVCSIQPTVYLYFKQIHSLRFEVFTVVVMKSIVFWDMTPCSPSSFSRRIGGTYHLHLQGQRNQFSKNQRASRWFLLNVDPKDGGGMFLRNGGWNSTDYTASYPRRWYSSNAFWKEHVMENVREAVSYLSSGTCCLHLQGRWRRRY